MRSLVVVVTMAVLLSGASPALAQRFTFEGWFDAAGVSVLDVTTLRGSIAVVAGDADRVRVTAIVTVRVAWDTPANAVDLAQQVAKAPPIERDGATIRLRPPTDSAQRRATTV